MRIALYAGSFDPPTNGHLWMIETGAQLFDKLIVGVGVNPDKTGHRFPFEERLEMLEAITHSFPNVAITEYPNIFLVDFARKTEATYVLRGIRNSGDYQKERSMRYVNHDLAPEIEHVYLKPPRDLAEVSSSLVMGMVKYENWEEKVKRYVPERVFERIARRFA